MVKTLPPDSMDSTRARSALVHCSYKNRSHNPQILRIRHSSGYFVTRVAYPGRSVLFSAPIDAFLEIQSDFLITSGYMDYVPCQKLQVKVPANVIHTNVDVTLPTQVAAQEALTLKSEKCATKNVSLPVALPVPSH